jgi:hypothetical protein
MTALRPAPALRIGLLLPGRLPESDFPLDAIAAQLAAIVARSQAILAEPPALAVHGQQAPLLRAVLALTRPAGDAERPLAEVVRACGCSLHLVIAHGRDAPPAWVAEALSEAGTCLRLDAAATAALERSRQAAQRVVIRHADLLLAVWDGSTAEGAGATMRFAARSGPPVLVLDPASPEAPRWCLGPADLHALESPPCREATDAALEAHLRRLLLPPEDHVPHPHGSIAALAGRLSAGATPPGLAEMLSAPAPRHHWAAGLYQFLRRRIGAHPAREAQDAAAAPGPAQDPPAPSDYWRAAQAPVSALAEVSAARYRSSYIGIFVLGALSLIAAFAALAFPNSMKLFGTGLELALLLGIGLIVMRNHARHWHARWIGARMISELCRKQAFLAPLGWSLQGFAAERMSNGPQDAWRAWYVAALQRAAPLPDDVFTPDRVAALREALLRSPVASQRRYHGARPRWCGRAAERLASWAEGFFVATLVMVCVKLGAVLVAKLPPAASLSVALVALPAGVLAGAAWRGERLWRWRLPACFCQRGVAREALMLGGGAIVLVTSGLAAGSMWPGIIAWLGFLAGALPALAAAFLGIRSYAELELLSQQSKRMLAVVEAAEAELRAIRPEVALASQDLGTIAADLAQRMLDDVEGWSTLFRVKVVETP